MSKQDINNHIDTGASLHEVANKQLEAYAEVMEGSIFQYKLGEDGEFERRVLSKSQVYKPMYNPADILRGHTEDSRQKMIDELNGDWSRIEARVAAKLTGEQLKRSKGSAFATLIGAPGYKHDEVVDWDLIEMTRELRMRKQVEEWRDKSPLDFAKTFAEGFNCASPDLDVPEDAYDAIGAGYIGHISLSPKGNAAKAFAEGFNDASPNLQVPNDATHKTPDEATEEIFRHIHGHQEDDKDTYDEPEVIKAFNEGFESDNDNHCVARVTPEPENLIQCDSLICAMGKTWSAI